MSTAIAKIIAAVIIVIALLAGMILLVLYKAPPEAVAAASTAFGIAVAAVVPMITGKDTGKGPGAAAVLLAAAGAFAGESGCAPPLTPKDCTVVGFREGDEACMRQYTAEGERIACRRANAKACGVVFTPSPEAAK